MQSSSNSYDPLVIVGIGLRLPDANTLDEFWNNLVHKVDSVKKVGKERGWNEEMLYREAKPGEPAEKGKTYTLNAAFLKDHDKFDASPFRGLSPLEIKNMDPQHRLALETSWAAFEDAGLSYDDLDESSTGVYVGQMNHDFLVESSKNYEHANNFTATGNNASITSNHVSYVFNLHGPSLTVDTACSSSLICLHLAGQAIQNGDCEQAIIIGVNSLLIPGVFIQLSQAGMLSREGHSKPFDESADGYTRGEGAGAVLVKPLSKALRDNDKIYSVILGSGSNSDGRSAIPITSPSEEIQAQLTKHVLKRFNISSGSISYIEAHGTGTSTGDPIEAKSLGKVFGASSGRKDPVHMGSLKGNVGHLESAAGVGALIKVCLMLKHQQIVPTVQFKNPSPKIPFDELKITIPTEVVPWIPIAGYRRRAAINSFGFGGSNSHVILEEFTPVSPHSLCKGSKLLPPYPVSISGVDFTYIHDYAVSLKQLLQSGDINLLDLAYTTSARKSHFSQRVTILANETNELLQVLDKLISEDQAAIQNYQRGNLLKKNSVQSSKHLCFVFNGQGTFWKGMAENLFHIPVFDNALKEFDVTLTQLAGWSVHEYLKNSKDKDNYYNTVSIVALQYALFRLLAHWNIHPTHIVGHSLGETMVPIASGLLELSQGVEIVHHRARLQQTTSGTGRMAAVGVSKETANTWLKDYNGKIVIAAVNSPVSITLSGDGNELQKLEKFIQSTSPSTFFVWLNISSAFHSPYMDVLKDEFLKCCSHIHPTNPPKNGVSIYSTVTGKLSTSTTDFSGVYFWENIRNQVLFSDALKEILQDGCKSFVVIGPTPALQRNLVEVNQAFDSHNSWNVISTLNPKSTQWGALMNTVAHLFTLGYRVDWRAVFGERDDEEHRYVPSLISLPAYPWRKVRYWPDGKSVNVAKSPSSSANQVVQYSYLETKLETHEVTLEQNTGWKTEFSLSKYPYMKDHVVQGVCLVPGASYLEYAVVGAFDLHSYNDLKEKGLSVGIHCTFENPTILSEDNSVNLFLQFEHANITTDSLEHTLNGKTNGINGNHISDHINGNGKLNGSETTTTPTIELLKSHKSLPFKITGDKNHPICHGDVFYTPSKRESELIYEIVPLVDNTVKKGNFWEKPAIDDYLKSKAYNYGKQFSVF